MGDMACEVGKSGESHVREAKGRQYIKWEGVMNYGQVRKGEN